MKKMVYAIALCTVFILGACSNATNKGVNKVKNDSVSEEEQVQGVDVHKGVTNVELTLPAMFFEKGELDDTIAKAKESGVKEVTKNEDGSLTYLMSKKHHKELLNELKETVREQVLELETDTDFASIEKVAHDKQFHTFTIQVKREEFENSFDGFALFGLAFSSLFYQAMDGKGEGEMDVRMDIVDIATGKIFESVHYPEAFDAE